MEVRATYRYAKISPFKAREITREIQGLPVSAALDVVAYSPKKAAKKKASESKAESGATETKAEKSAKRAKKERK